MPPDRHKPGPLSEHESMPRDSKLTAYELEQIQSLVAEPLANTVRAQMDAASNKLAGSIEGLTEKLAGHIDRAAAAALANEDRIAGLSLRVGRLETLATQARTVWTAATLGVGIVLSELAHWLFGTTKH